MNLSVNRGEEAEGRRNEGPPWRRLRRRAPGEGVQRRPKISARTSESLCLCIFLFFVDLQSKQCLGNTASPRSPCQRDPLPGRREANKEGGQEDVFFYARKEKKKQEDEGAALCFLPCSGTRDPLQGRREASGEPSPPTAYLFTAWTPGWLHNLPRGGIPPALWGDRWFREIPLPTPVVEPAPH